MVAVGEAGGSLEYKDGGDWKKVEVGVTLSQDTKLRSQSEDGATQTAWAEVTLEAKDREGVFRHYCDLDFPLC